MHISRDSTAIPGPSALAGKASGFVPVRCGVAGCGWSSGRAFTPRNSAWLATARVRPGPPPQSCHDGGTTVRSEIALSHQQFGVEDGCASGAADGIVAQHDEAVPQHAVRGDAAYRDAHAAPGVAVEPGLRAMGLDRDAGGGMSVTVGRITSDTVRA